MNPSWQTSCGKGHIGAPDWPVAFIDGLVSDAGPPNAAFAAGFVDWRVLKALSSGWRGESIGAFTYPFLALLKALLLRRSTGGSVANVKSKPQDRE